MKIIILFDLLEDLNSDFQDNLKQIKTQTSLNKQYALRALFAPSGFEKPQSPTALCGFLSPTFQPTANLRFAL